MLTGRTNDEVNADPDRLWRSDLPAAEAADRAAAAAAGPLTGDELAALDDLGRGGHVGRFGRTLKVTNLDKELFPAAAGRGAGHQARPSPLRRRRSRRPCCPTSTGRALNMHRYPDGADGRASGTRSCPTHAPEWLPRWDNPDADPGETGTYLVVDEPAALAWAANFGAIEWHAWTSRTDAPTSRRTR